MALIFLIELYAIEKDEEVQNSFNQADLILNATGVGMDGHSLPIASHLTFPPQALIVEMAYYPAVTPLSAISSESRKPEGKWAGNALLSS